MKLTIVAAMAENRIVGLNGKLPWHLPSELAHFRRVTIGKPMIMGRKTFESIGRPLPGRETIVVSRTSRFPGCQHAASLEAAISIARGVAERLGADDIAIVGGAAIYEQAMPLADRIRLTVIRRAFEGDASFPEIPEERYRLIQTDNLESQSDLDPAMAVELYEAVSLRV